jgi:hypothetical protein
VKKKKQEHIKNLQGQRFLCGPTSSHAFQEGPKFLIETLALKYSFFLESPLLFKKKYLFVFAQILWSAQKGYSTSVLKITSLFIFEIC